MNIADKLTFIHNLIFLDDEDQQKAGRLGFEITRHRPADMGDRNKKRPAADEMIKTPIVPLLPSMKMGNIIAPNERFFSEKARYTICIKTLTTFGDVTRSTLGIDPQITVSELFHKLRYEYNMSPHSAEPAPKGRPQPEFEESLSEDNGNIEATVNWRNTPYRVLESNEGVVTIFKKDGSSPMGESSPARRGVLKAYKRLREAHITPTAT